MTPATRTGRALATAAILAGLFVALGVVDGVFARLGLDVLLALAVFATGFALATYLLDREVRAWVRERYDAIRKWGARPPSARRDGHASRRTSARGSAARRARAAG